MLFERGGGRQGRYVVQRDRGEVEKAQVYFASDNAHLGTDRRQTSRQPHDF